VLGLLTNLLPLLPQLGLCRVLGHLAVLGFVGRNRLLHGLGLRRDRVEHRPQAEAEESAGGSRGHRLRTNLDERLRREVDHKPFVVVRHELFDHLVG